MNFRRGWARASTGERVALVGYVVLTPVVILNLVFLLSGGVHWLSWVTVLYVPLAVLSFWNYYQRNARESAQALVDKTIPLQADDDLRT